MNEQANANGFILNRGKKPQLTEEPTAEAAVSREQENKEAKLEAIAQMSTNSALASQFPEWDLKPPVTLLKRRSSKWV